MPESDDIATRVAPPQVPFGELEKQLADLRARLPAHSIPPSIIPELDELEEALEQARWQRQEERANKRK